MEEFERRISAEVRKQEKLDRMEENVKVKSSRL